MEETDKKVPRMEKGAERATWTETVTKTVTVGDERWEDG